MVDDLVVGVLLCLFGELVVLLGLFYWLVRFVGELCLFVCVVWVWLCW